MNKTRLVSRGTAVVATAIVILALAVACALMIAEYA